MAVNVKGLINVDVRTDWVVITVKSAEDNVLHVKSHVNMVLVCQIIYVHVIKDGLDVFAIKVKTHSKLFYFKSKIKSVSLILGEKRKNAKLPRR